MSGADEIEELRKYSATAFEVEQAYQLASALHILHRLRNTKPLGISDEMLAQRRALFEIVIRLLKSELMTTSRNLNDALVAWEKAQHATKA